LCEARVPAGPEELAALETDVFAGFVLARAAAGLADATIASDVANLEQIRAVLRAVVNPALDSIVDRPAGATPGPNGPIPGSGQGRPP
jgi:hypothetical protein